MKKPLCVTLRKLRRANACVSGYNKLVYNLAGIEPPHYFETNLVRYHYNKQIPLLYILESNGLTDAIWALRCFPKSNKKIALFVIELANLYAADMTELSYDALNDFKLWVESDFKASRKPANALQIALNEYTKMWNNDSTIKQFVAASTVYNTVDNIFHGYNQPPNGIVSDAYVEKVKEMFIKLCNS